MTRSRLLLAAACFAALCTPLAAPAQQRAPAQRFPEAPGREVALTLCFQCHSDAMWTDHREDRRGWEGVLYRMVGRGALWTEDEIRIMSGYFAAAFGPRAARPAK